MDPLKNTARTLPFIPLLVTILLIGLSLFAIKTYLPTLVPQKPHDWFTQARLELTAGRAISSPPVDLPGRETMVATALPSLLLGLNDNVILTCEHLLIGNDSRLSLDFPGSEKAAIQFGASGAAPLIHRAPNGFSPPAVETSDVMPFLRTTPSGFLQPTCLPGSVALALYLQFSASVPQDIGSFTTEEKDLVLGPLYKVTQAGRPEKEPLRGIIFPSDPQKVPQAAGLHFEFLRRVPTPTLDWTPDFKTQMGSYSSLQPFIHIWENRQALLGSYVPLLMDDVGNLLRSGALRFNRPDVFPASGTVLSPMDEIVYLRGLFHASCFSRLFHWYPRPASCSGLLSSDPFQSPQMQRLAKKFATPELLIRYLENSLSPQFDHFLWLENGDLELNTLAASHTLWIGCASGSITLKGPINGDAIFLATRGGNIILTGGQRSPHLLAMEANQTGGSVIVRQPVQFWGSVRCQTLDLSSLNGSCGFSPPDLPFPGRMGIITP